MQFMAVYGAIMTPASFTKSTLRTEIKRAFKSNQLWNKAVYVQGPRCSLRSGSMYSDCTPDYLKMTALNIPAALVVRTSSAMYMFCLSAS